MTRSIRFSEPPHACRNCEQPYHADELDRQWWCTECRRVVVRRASLWGRGSGLVAALLLVLWIVPRLGPSPRIPLVIWMVLIAAAYLFVMKIVRRIAFEIIRNRGVAPEED